MAEKVFEKIFDNYFYCDTLLPVGSRLKRVGLGQVKHLSHQGHLVVGGLDIGLPTFI